MLNMVANIVVSFPMAQFFQEKMQRHSLQKIALSSTLFLKGRKTGG